ncbi:MAG: putative Ig domain-containing protein, partial [Candidatus Omnitrophica bacterium]|nr:putative Ig domain-containing protein [Candidatus Omnitrophota bacterium]
SDWARPFLAGGDAASYASTLNNWYPEVSQWIERGTNSGAIRDLACTSCCSVCAAQDGALWRWYDEIREMKTRLEAWRDTSFAGAACTDVWCVPPAGCPGGKNTSGTYNVTFRVSDGSLTDSEVVPITVGRVNNQPPVLNTIGSQAVNELANLNFTISGSDPDNAALIYSAAGLPAGATFNPSTQVFDWTPGTGTSGTYNVTFSVSDRSLTDSEVVPITVGGVLNQPPVLNTIGSKAVNESVNLNFTISGSDPEGAVLTYSATGLPTGAAFNTSTQFFDWTPVGTYGTYNVTFSVSDGSLTDSEVVPITAGGVNQPPVLNTIGSRGTNELVPLNFTISGYDPEGAALTYSATGLPTGATFTSTGVFNWTPGTGTSGSGLTGGLGPEENTFESNGNGIRGDFTDVAACLNWNVNDRVTTTSAVPVTATGNYEKFRECDNACTDVRDNINLARALDANQLCSSLPRSLVPGFDTIAYVPTELAELLACQTSLTAANCTATPSLTCVAYGVTYTCSTSGSIATAISSRIAAGSCTDTTAVGFIMSLRASIPEAQNQVVKFSKRYAFLSGRLAELDNFISVLDRAEREFLGFLTCADADGDGQPDGAACRLIKAAMANFDNSGTGMPSYKAVYGWQSEPQKGQPTGSGKWHIVRVDARIPKRCDNSCNWDQTPNGGDPEWPWVKTKVDMWGARRCYELTSTNGVAKVRVSRYDETSALATLFFPNAVEIWKSWFTRADRPEMASPDTIGSACAQNMASGREACVKYYYENGAEPRGMNFKFVPCANF